MLLTVGLARTSEIFGVSELVLSNIKVLEEKQFQSLSVTAEKWLTITEVRSCPIPHTDQWSVCGQRSGRMHPNLGRAIILLAHDPLSSLAYPMITHTPP